MDDINITTYVMTAVPPDAPQDEDGPCVVGATVTENTGDGRERLIGIVVKVEPHPTDPRLEIVTVRRVSPGN